MLLAGVLGTAPARAEDEASAPVAAPDAVPPGPAPIAQIAVREGAASPPQITGILPGRFDRAEAIANVGEELSLTLDASHPEGLPLRASALGLPVGAEFSEPLRRLRWTPSAAQRGRHVVRFVVSDGAREASRTWTVLVTDNRPPVFVTEVREISYGQFHQVSLTASDPDDDPLTYAAESLPEGAELDPSGVLSWRPLEEQLGDHRVRVTAFDGTVKATGDFVVLVEPPPREKREADNWESYFLPGAGYALYAPRANDDLGVFHGVSLEVLIGAWIHRNDNRGPSHGRVYVNVEILDSTDHLPVLFVYGMGFSLSLERNPRRTWLIPTYGVDVGGLIQDDIGAKFQSTPYLGLHFYSNRNVFLTGRGGYRLVPTELERLGGWHASFMADFSIW